MMIEAYQLFYRYIKYLTLSQMIEQIRVKYQFRDDFDFYYCLRDIKIWMKLIKDKEDITVTSEAKKLTKEVSTLLYKAANKLETLLARRDDFLGCLDPFKTEDLLYSKKQKLSYEELIENCSDASATLRNCSDSLPATRKGRPLNTYCMRCVNLLIEMFMGGSDLELICYKNDERYSGNFYHFMIDMIPILQELGININKIKHESLGRYAAELIPQRRKDKPYTGIIFQSQIDESDTANKTISTC
ncbi:hypothetical protein [Legionella resiliens]|uniref:Uncharacterized protein n=1 Tax=Legionella resiliens TaxID=2905958 RepID=A0ABS8X306_9GAMM|nr:MULTISPECIES: hypothetical protein [unclassified Legionella]MCE0723993.1 hypothetical protein [Legionella sp. 9fVS26]MCE3533146.1 hypothetical protein [Legionella sp. 8cVS16]